MAVTANQIIKRRGRDGKIREVPVAANAVLYEGTLCYEDAGGDAAAAIVDETTSFLGINRYMVDNTGGADGAKKAEVYTDGDFELVGSGFTAADLGATVYGIDNFTVSKTATDRPRVGIITKVISATLALVSIKGLGEADLGAVVSS
jgi:hypothetical protein